MNTTDATRRTDPKTLGQWFSSGPAHLYALSFWLLSLVLFLQPLRNLASLSSQDEDSSHVLLIPFISGFLLYLERKPIFRASRFCPAVGAPLLLIVAVLRLVLNPWLSRLTGADRVSGIVFLVVWVWIGGFILFYGMTSFRAGAFPLLFLLLMIPIPGALAHNTVLFLQRGSAEVCYALFRVTGVPFVRHGFQFSLPGVDIEVAQQCSGIHSALALLIAGLLLQHLFLTGTWKKVLFTLCIFPVAIFKNAVRIVTIAWLGIHVNPDFFHGQLHRQGGLPFAVLAVAVLGVLLYILRLPVFSRPPSTSRLSSGLA